MKKKLAVWKFSSCDGCQLSLLDCEDAILELADAIEISHFLEASGRILPGPYDLSIVEGSITTPEEFHRIREIREMSQRVITIGACATSGGIQALKNYADINDYIKTVYARPDYIKTLATSTGISEHIPVDFELRGCPINKDQLLEVIKAFLQDRKPRIPDESVCIECKLKSNLCIAVSHQVACLGPVTQGGCEALCPTYYRGCFGCYGPKSTANIQGLINYFRDQGIPDSKINQLFGNFNVANSEFLKGSNFVDSGKPKR